MAWNLELIPTQVQMGWVHSTLPKLSGGPIVADKVPRFFPMLKNIKDLDVLRRSVDGVKKGAMLSMKTNQRPTRMSRSTRGRLDLPIGRLNASSRKCSGSRPRVYVDAPSVEAGALADIDVEKDTRTFVEDGVARSSTGILKDETLTRLRGFVLGSTVFTGDLRAEGIWALSWETGLEPPASYNKSRPS